MTAPSMIPPEPMDLEELAEMLRQCLPGPVNLNETNVPRLARFDVEVPHAVIAQNMYGEEARLFVALRNAAPALLSELRSLRERLSAVRAETLEEGARFCDHVGDDPSLPRDGVTVAARIGVHLRSLLTPAAAPKEPDEHA